MIRLKQPILTRALPDIADSSLIGSYLNHRVIGTGKDYSVNENDATTIIAVSWDEVGGTWDGANSSILVPNHPDWQTLFNGGGTIEAWVNPASDGESNLGTIVFKNASYQLRVEAESGDALKITLNHDFSGDNGQWTSTNREVDLNAWNQIVFCYDNSSIDNDPTVFVNNSLPIAFTEISTPTGTADTNTNDVYVGNNNFTNRTWDGQLACINAYSEEKSADWTAYRWLEAIPEG